MEVEDVEIDLLTRSGNVDELCEASTSGNVARCLDQFATVGEPRDGMEFESKEAAYYFYRENKYRIPFTPFIGVSHHCQYVLLGCALIGEEIESTYSWLFRPWLKAVGGHAPRVMITDQDKLLSDIVVEVFPSARHFICLWNVLSKIPEMLNPFVSQDDGFMESFRNCVHNSWTYEQFERMWSNIISKFELNENEWLQLLFRDRKKWVPLYFHGICLARLSGPERPGSVASQFDNYMNSKATFKDFFELYGPFLQYRSNVEAKDYLESQSKQPTLRCSLAFEKQLSLIYTDAAFKKFQAEVPGVVSCQLRKEREDGTTTIFRVEDFEEQKILSVALNKELLDYILKRWSKGCNNIEGKKEKCVTIHNRMARFDDLCRRFVKLGEAASLSDEAYKTALTLLEETKKHCVNNSPKLNDATNMSEELPQETVFYAHEQVSSRAPTFENCYIPQAVMEETEQGSRFLAVSSTQDGYYGHPPTIQAMVRSFVYFSYSVQAFVITLRVNLYHRPKFNFLTFSDEGSMYSQPSIQGAFQGQSGFRGSVIRGCYDIEETLHDMTMESSQFQGSGPSNPSNHRMFNQQYKLKSSSSNLQRCWNAFCTKIEKVFLNCGIGFDVNLTLIGR
ncbi:PREDICTED: protein FAR1-RELATED SEQUENCE 2 [Camelina sativa]|uniref:Protein FAR1-RELATED SEQUENCE n=1 Tax=Camelina sativa TaxID=90675 RepID=A0ABM0WNZ8_CAMSA|nr:PREDICTED: protein FAR1-RELATED SEQUENCE 2 [Camelina sativa]